MSPGRKKRERLFLAKKGKRFKKKRRKTKRSPRRRRKKTSKETPVIQEDFPWENFAAWLETKLYFKRRHDEKLQNAQAEEGKLEEKRKVTNGKTFYCKNRKRRKKKTITFSFAPETDHPLLSTKLV